LHIKIPDERIGVLVGPKGSTKRTLEEKTGAELDVDSETGSVTVTSGEDPLQSMRLVDTVQAIARGFSPERAMTLLDEDILMLDVMDLSNVAHTKNGMARIKGRIIGKDGRTRETMERLTNAMISVYGKTVSIIGNPDQIRVARTAIEMLIDGAPHGSVYGYLEKKRQDLIQSDMGDF